MKKFFTFFAATLAAITMSAANLTVAEALAMGNALEDNAQTDTVVVEGFAINVTPYDISFGNQQFYLADDAASTSTDFMVFRAKPTKNGAAYPVLAGDKVQLKGVIKKYVKDESTPAQVEIMYPSVTFVTEVAGDRTLATSTEITVAQALEIGATLEVGEKTTDTYDIVGYVTQVDNNSMETYGNMEFWIADSNNGAATNADGAFLVFRGKPSQAVKPGDKVSVKTIIQNYKGTIESNSSVPVTILAEGEGGDDDTETADVVFTFEDFANQGVSGTGGPVTATKDGVTFTCDKGYGDGKYGVRCYKGSNVSITSATEQIAKIVFDFPTVSGTYYNGGLDVENVVNGLEWTASSLGSQARMNTISIYFGTAEEIKLDTLTATEAKTMAESLAENTQSDKVVVLAYVASIKTAYNPDYENITVWLTDDPTSTYGDIQAYRAKCTAEVGNTLMAGDKVMVVGQLKHSTYESDGEIKHSYEIAQGAELTLVSTEGIEEVVLTENVQKVMVDGVLYIVRDNKMYNVQGIQVR